MDLLGISFALGSVAAVVLYRRRFEVDMGFSGWQNGRTLFRVSNEVLMVFRNFRMFWAD